MGICGMLANEYKLFRKSTSKHMYFLSDQPLIRQNSTVGHWRPGALMTWQVHHQMIMWPFVYVSSSMEADM